MIQGNYETSFWRNYLFFRGFHLRIIQQPTSGCAFGGNLLARLALAPPLIVQLQVLDQYGHEVEMWVSFINVKWIDIHLKCRSEELQSLVCHVTLLTADGQPANMLSPTISPRHSPYRPRRSSSRLLEGGIGEPPSPRITSTQPLNSVRMLYGTLVASPLQLNDVFQRKRVFFIFPEISVRSRGRFRLHIVLMRMPLWACDVV